MAYGIPQAPADATAYAQRLISLWEPRDRRFDADQDLYEQQPLVLDGAQVALALPDGRIAADTVAGRLASAEIVYECAAGSEPDEANAQAIEDLVYYTETVFAERWQQALNTPLRHTEAHYGVLRGWLCGELLLNPTDPAFPWLYSPVDPRELYPAPTRDSTAPACIVRRLCTTAEDLCQHPLWGKRAERILGANKSSKPDEQNLEVFGFYTPTHLGLVLENEWLKPPTKHNYGFNPLLMVLASGAPYRYTERTATGSTDRSGRDRVQTRRNEDWTQEVGAGLLTVLRPAYRDKELLLTDMRSIVAAQADPGFLYKSRGANQVDPESVGPKMKMTDDQDASLDVFYPQRVAFQDMLTLLNPLQDQINHVLPPTMFGGGGPMASGWERNIVSHNDKHVLLPFARALETFYLLRARAVLRLFERFGAGIVGAQGLQYLAREGVSLDGLLRRSAVQRLSPLQVAQADFRIRVRLLDRSPQDRAMMANTVIGLNREGLIDPLTLLGDEWLGVRNPREVYERALRAQRDKMPEWVRLNALRKEVFAMWQRIQAQDPSVDLEEYQDLALLYQQTRQQFLTVVMRPTVGPPTAAGGPPNDLVPNPMAQGAGLPPNQSMLGPQASGPVPQPEALPGGP